MFIDQNTTASFRLPLGVRFLRRLAFPRKLGILGGIYGGFLAKQGVAWVHTSAGPIWKLDLRNSTHRWIVFGDYEGPGFIGWAKNWVREDSVVVDSGANIGQVLLYLAPQIKTGKYIAFEPFPPARDWLTECLQRYPDWPVKIEKFGLGERVGTASLEGQWGGDAAVGSHTELKIGTGDVLITTLDEYVEKNKIGEIRLWKLDMEGAEEAALRGAEHLLERQAIESLVLETDSERFFEVTKMLGDYGYLPLDWNGRKVKAGSVSSFGNVLFKPSKKN